MGQAARGRISFNHVARQYDSARPCYPDALFDDIESLSRIPPKSHILEIGCGTGQATLPMAQRGYAVDAIELGENLAGVAKAKLARIPAARVICADFETFSIKPGKYDMVLSATAFHWIAPDIRFQKAHEALQPDGALALFWIRPAQTDASRHYQAALQAVYESIAPQLTRYYVAPPHPSQVTTAYAEAIPASGLFAAPQTQKHYVATEYDAETYIALLGTFSDHLLLPAAARKRLFAAIADLIESEFEGKIIREGVALLYVARRL